MAASYDYAYTRLGVDTPRSMSRSHWWSRRLASIVFAGVFVLIALHLLNFLPGSWSPHDSSMDYWDSLFRARLYVPIDPTTPRLTRSRRHYPTDWCLEASLGGGEMCNATEYGLHATPQIDLVWSWVNSSDPAWRRAHAMVTARRQGNESGWGDVVEENIRFDNYDELRHSMRSAWRAWGNGVRRFHLLAADFPLPPEYPISIAKDKRSTWRLGQMPTWLVHPDPAAKSMLWRPNHHQNVAGAYWTAEQGGGGPELAVHHHSTYFDPYVGTSFSSFGIESQLPNLRGVGDIFIYLNDDMYFLRDHVVSDYWSAPLGLVMRPQTYLSVPPTPDPTPSGGEWQPLRFTNYILSRRFGAMPRVYLTHQPKVGSITLWREFSTMFSEQFNRSRMRQFREVYWEDPADVTDSPKAELPFPFNLDPEVNTEGRGTGSSEKADVHTTFGLGHYVIERHREALLWSWAVGRIGGMDGSFNITAAWAALGGSEGQTMLRIKSWDYGKGDSRDSRRGGRLDDTLNTAGFTSRKTADYYFVSTDGHFFYDWRTEWKERDAGLLNMEAGEICLIRRDECFLEPTTSAAAFVNIAFARAQCGDCIIQALVHASGRLGLSAFLPPHSRNISVAPHNLARTLPIGQRWEEIDFSLSAALSSGVPGSMREDGEAIPTEHSQKQPINLRKWVLRVLDRYRYSFAYANVKFLLIRNVEEAERVVVDVDSGDANTACINDNVMLPADIYNPNATNPITVGQKVAEIMHNWQSRRWPAAPAWERSET